MVEGRFLKNGEIIEVSCPNGLTELIVADNMVVSEYKPMELHAITFFPRKQERKENKRKNIAIISSMFLPIAVLIMAWNGLLDGLVAMIFFILAWVWDGMVVYSNARRKI